MRVSILHSITTNKDGKEAHYIIYTGDKQNQLEPAAANGLLKANAGANNPNVQDIATLTPITASHAFKPIEAADTDKLNEGKTAIADALTDNAFNAIKTAISGITFTNDEDVHALKGNLKLVEAELAKAKALAGAANATEEVKKGYEAAAKKFNDLKAAVAKFRQAAQEVANTYGKDKVVGSIFVAYDKEDVVDFAEIAKANTDDAGADYGLVLKEDKDDATIIGRDEIRNKSTRIFGHNYGYDIDDANKANSWSRAVLYAAEPTGQQLGLDNIQLGVVPPALKHVQYDLWIP